MGEQPDLVKQYLASPDIAIAKSALAAFCQQTKADMLLVLNMLIIEQHSKGNNGST